MAFKDNNNILINRALFKSKNLGASYADIRIVYKYENYTSVWNDDVDAIDCDYSIGFGVRVLVKGCWGFSSSNKLTSCEIDKVVSQAIDIAEESTKINNKIILAPVNPSIAQIYPDVEIDTRTIDLTEKVSLLLETINIMKQPSIISRFADCYDVFEKKYFGSTEGSLIYQENMLCGASFTVKARNKDIIVDRTYPNTTGGGANRGWEYIRSLNLIPNAEKYANEAISLSRAKQCPKGKKDIILGQNQMAIQIHESIGHPLELDRILGFEEGFAGRSFVNVDMLNNLQYGSKIVNIVVDPTHRHAFGSIEYDDEGVKAKKIHLIKDGILVGFLNSRETAAFTCGEPIGAMRSESWCNVPIVRMTSIDLEPGDMSLDQLINGIDDGILMDDNCSWSIDDKRDKFQFSTQIGWEIKNGKIGEMLRHPSYSGSTINFWNSCDGIGNRSLWKISGFNGCGKGEPLQIMYLSHGSSPARFRNVDVGVGNE